VVESHTRQMQPRPARCRRPACPFPAASGGAAVRVYGRRRECQPWTRSGWRLRLSS